MMLFKKMESSEGFLEMDMDREQKSGFRKGGPCGRWMGLLVLLGAVAMGISMMMIFVICRDLVKKVTEVQNSVSSLDLYLNKSSDPKPNERPTCRSGWIMNGSSCYLFSTNTLNWTEARDYCKKQGASLLKLDGSEAEWEFVMRKALPNVYWIGLTDQTTGQWRWTDGTPYIMNKEHWDEGQPDDWKDPSHGEETEDCALIRWNGKLNDSHCYSKYRYLCKV